MRLKLQHPSGGCWPFCHVTAIENARGILTTSAAIVFVLPLSLSGSQLAAQTGACGRIAAVPAPGTLPPPVARAQIRDEAGTVLVVSDKTGAFCLSGVHTGGSVVAAGYLPATWAPPPSEEFWSGQSWVITLEPAPKAAESIEVTAYRTPLANLDSPASTRTLDQTTLDHAAPLTLDGKLREIPGFELFRRTSALVANPTTQGLSLRGLGSTAASRTLVVSNDIPLNDPYGGWIHWDELPSLAIRSVEVVRGGASDLYGSSAIGGVVNVIPVVPTQGSRQLELLSGYGAEATTDNAALGTFAQGPDRALFAAGLTATDGYTLVAPALRGAVDVPSNVHAETGLVELDRRVHGTGSESRVFVRSNVLNENRHNGTPLTTNATRLWRYAVGAELASGTGQLSARAFGSSEHYFQSFSSVTPGRATEKFSHTGEDPASELGASLRWTKPVFQDTLIVAGGDVRDVRAADYSFPALTVSNFGAPTSTTARQRQTGGYAEVLATPDGWTLSGSARVDHFTNGDAARYSPASGVTQEPSLSETVIDPRLGISRRITPALALNASGFRAYRAPTENELYRTGQVGQQTTLPNPDLRSERATGWEVGIAGAQSGSPVAAWRASYFWTRVNRPITALTLSTTPTAATLIRENLGRIESRGISLDGNLHPTVTLPAGTSLTFQGGYQFAVATVTSYVQEPSIVGKWIPQVARNAGTLQASLTSARLGSLSLEARASGRQFDDDQNLYELHGYVRFDVYASHGFGRRYEAFAAVENLLDRSIDAGRTPVRTLGTPQLARFGVRIRLGD